MTNYEDFLRRARKEHGEKFDSSKLAAQFIEAYNNKQRVEVTTMYSTPHDYGEAFVRRGTIGITTGWRPTFILMHTRHAIGSWDVLGKDDRITARIDARGKRIPV